MDAKFKKQLIIGAIILLALFGFAFYYYKKGKRSTSIAPLVNDNPGSTAANNNPAGMSDAAVKQLADALYTDMNGLNALGHQPEPYASLLAGSDTDFEKVYNAFNTNHQAEGNGTLKGWIENEHPLYDPQFDAYRTSILERMSKLNLI